MYCVVLQTCTKTKKLKLGDETEEFHLFQNKMKYQENIITLRIYSKYTASKDVVEFEWGAVLTLSIKEVIKLKVSVPALQLT